MFPYSNINNHSPFCAILSWSRSTPNAFSSLEIACVLVTTKVLVGEVKLKTGKSL